MADILTNFIASIFTVENRLPQHLYTFHAKNVVFTINNMIIYKTPSMDTISPRILKETNLIDFFNDVNKM